MLSKFYSEKPVGYRVYIRKDYKPLVWGESGKRCWGLGSTPIRVPFLFLLFALAATLILYLTTHSMFPFTQKSGNWGATRTVNADAELNLNDSLERRDSVADMAPPAEGWSSVTIRPGDNLSLIFARENLSAKSLDMIMNTGTDAKLLTNLRPGQTIEYQAAGDRLDALRFAPSHWESLEVRRIGESFQTSLIKADVETRTQTATGIITDSLFMSGQRAGLSDPLIMDLISIYAWDVDFALEVRAGDSFKVLYEEYFRDGKRIGSGPILAAEFVNQGKSYGSVWYVAANGHTDYYSESGLAMRKAFLRTPLNFTRISSTFSLGRRHPILNSMRAHRGVDYAAPQGTPIKAAGDGTVVSVGGKGGYGRTVVLRHGEKYSTLYAHLSRYAPGLRAGNRIKQGKIIGYVGMTGLATGPHLHYEFQVAGVHRNPLTVDLPKVESISTDQWPRFQQQAAPLLAQLGIAAPARGNMVALGETEAERSVVH